MNFGWNFEYVSLSLFFTLSVTFLVIFLLSFFCCIHPIVALKQVLKRKFLSVAQHSGKVRDRATCLCSPDIKIKLPGSLVFTLRKVGLVKT